MSTRFLIPVLTVMIVASLAWFLLPRDTSRPGGRSVPAGSSPDIQNRLAAIEGELARGNEARISLQFRYDELLEILDTDAMRYQAVSSGQYDAVGREDTSLGLVLTDTVDDGDCADKVLANAPAGDGAFFTVPKVIE